MVEIVIMCSRCRAPVRRWEIFDDIVTMDRVYRVWCHGATDECKIDWRSIDPREIVEAVAFRALELSDG